MYRIHENRSKYYLLEGIPRLYHGYTPGYHRPYLYPPQVHSRSYRHRSECGYVRGMKTRGGGTRTRIKVWVKETMAQHACTLR